MTLEQKIRKLKVYEKVGMGITGLCLASTLVAGIYSIGRIATQPTKAEYVQMIKEENKDRSLGREIYTMAEQREQEDRNDIFRVLNFGFMPIIPAVLIPRMLLMAKYSRQEDEQ